MRKISFSLLRTFGFLTLTVLSGCGQASQSTTSSALTSSVTCTSGYIVSNGTCVFYETTTVTTSGSCIPVTQTVPFSGSSAAIDSIGDLYAGTIPNYSTAYGTMVVGTTSTSVSGSSYGGASTTYGTLQLNISSGLSSSSYYYTSGTASLSGSLMLSSYYQTLLQSYVTSNGYGTTACISGIALMGRLYSSSYYSGYVYVYLNGTQHGYVLGF